MIEFISYLIQICSCVMFSVILVSYLALRRVRKNERAS